MRTKSFYRAFPLVLLAFFNVIGGSVFSYNISELDPDSGNNHYLQEYQNTSALYLEEISPRGPVQPISKNDLGSGGYLICGTHSFNPQCLGDNKLSSKIIRDEKEILKTFIFPFHFFW